MNELSKIKKSIKNIAKDGSAAKVFTAKVKSVSGETCDIEYDGALLTDVRLRAVINGKNSKMLITPKIDSYVLIMDMNGDYTNLVVLNYSEIDRIDIDVETDIIINGGKNDGLVKIRELTEKLNDLKDWCKNHTHSNAVFKGTSETLGPITGSLTVPAPMVGPKKFSKEDYENINIKH